MTTARTMADVVEQTAADGLPDAPWVGGVGLTLWLLGHAWAVLCCAVLVVTDLREHRLPNRWTLRLALGGVVTAASLALLRGDPDLVTGAVLGGLMYTAGMAVLFVLSRGGLGLGDVKLAAGLGIYTGMFGVGTTAMAAVAAILIGGLISLALVVLGRARGSTPIPFGPAMVAGAIAALGIAVLNSGVQ